MPSLTQNNLMKLFSENWDHIRHMERYRILCLNIYAVILGGVLYAVSTGRVGSLFYYLAGFLVFFTIINLLIAIKIELVTNNFVRANYRIVEKLGIGDWAPIRTRQSWLENIIRFQWIFPVFYGASLIGVTALIAKWAPVGFFIGLLIFGISRAIRIWMYTGSAAQMDSLADVCATSGIGLDKLNESKESAVKWFDHFRRFYKGSIIFGKGRAVEASNYVSSVRLETYVQQELRDKARSFRYFRSNDIIWATLLFGLAGLAFGLFLHWPLIVWNVSPS